jgi:predicted metalloendopeptidase
MGDLGGVNAAYDGLQLYLKIPNQDLLTDHSWATFLHFMGNRLRTKSRDEAIKNQVNRSTLSRNVHAYVPVQNVDAFLSSVWY